MLLFEDLDLPLQTVWALIKRIFILYFIWVVTYLLKHLFKGLLKPKGKKVCAIIGGLFARKPVSEFLTKGISNQSPQLQRLARILKF